jgi:predicted RNase H-like HicB family nuclease
MSAVLWAAPEAGFISMNPETGTTSQGESEAEALRNLAEATALYLGEFPSAVRHEVRVTTFKVAQAE